MPPPLAVGVLGPNGPQSLHQALSSQPPGGHARLISLRSPQTSARFELGRMSASNRHLLPREPSPGLGSNRLAAMPRLAPEPNPFRPVAPPQSAPSMPDQAKLPQLRGLLPAPPISLPAGVGMRMHRHMRPSW